MVPGLRIRPAQDMPHSYAIRARRVGLRRAIRLVTCYDWFWEAKYSSTLETFQPMTSRTSDTSY